MRSTVQSLVGLIDGGSPFDVERFRQLGWARASTGLVAATAFSAIEQAMWDLAGQALEVPVYTLFGGKVRDALPVYANINRATNPRTPAGFADAARTLGKCVLRTGTEVGSGWRCDMDGLEPIRAAGRHFCESGSGCAHTEREF